MKDGNERKDICMRWVERCMQYVHEGLKGVVAFKCITEMAVFILATDYSCEMGYPFDNSCQIGNTS